MKNKKEMFENELNEREDSKNFSENENVEAISDEEIAGEEEAVADTTVADEQINSLKKELEEQKDKYVRLFAEFDNFRRRTSKESIELRQTAGIEVITSLLDVLDDIDRAETQLQESTDVKALKEGIVLIFNKFRKTLQSRGLKAIETLNSEFDVEKDEAVSEIEVKDKKLKGKVVAEVQKGYLLNDKLIRFAKVVVGK